MNPSTIAWAAPWSLSYSAVFRSRLVRRLGHPFLRIARRALRCRAHLTAAVMLLVAITPMTAYGAPTEERLNITPTMLSGPLNFLVTSVRLTHMAPIPYGIPNNANDSGWIWPNDNTGELRVAFPFPAALTAFRVYSTYAGGSRGASWAIEYSQDGTDWKLAINFQFVTTAGGGFNSDLTKRSDFAGWYGTSFNGAGTISAKHWRIRQTQVLVPLSCFGRLLTVRS